jgi:hypothetical protein
MSRSIRAVVATAIVCAAAAAPASASTLSIKAKTSTKLNSARSVFSGTGKDRKLGSFKVKGTFAVPNFDVVWTLKSGTLKLHVEGAINAQGYPTATWKVVSGTGKYKGASGSGKTSSSTKIGAPVAKQTYSGKIRVK